MAEIIELKKRHALSGWPMVLAWIAMIIFAFHASTHMVGAGDTWVAMACGRHFLNHGVDTVEPFSANSHRAGPTAEDIANWPAPAKWIAEKVGLKTVQYWHPTGWVNQNWLTHVIFYWITHESPVADADTFSFNSLVYWKFALYVLTIVCVYYTGKVMGVNPALSAFFACFAVFVGRSFFDIRPAGFSNMLTAIYLLILALTVYRNYLYIWLIVPLVVFWCNVHGGYLFVFMMLAPFVGLNLITVISKKKFLSIGLKGLYHTIGAGFASFIAMIVFNPFHLTNLTHTFEISLSPHAERWRNVNEWHPAFEWSNPVGDEIPFLIMYIIAWLVLVVWLFIMLTTSRSATADRKRKTKDDEYQWPKVNLAFIVIAAMSIYMAIRSRRFIPIAAIAACPLLALFVDQMVRSVSAVRNLHRQNRLAVSPMPRQLQTFFTIAAACAILFFGTWWGLKFKKVYLEPWPSDAKFNSVFMRMTASDAKPFYAMQFIRDNKLSGKMFNYWTEGGFIAWGQDADPNTGKTSLQLFMDGRAQAAYQIKIFDLWTRIMSGGPTVHSDRIRKQKVDYLKAGKWIDEQLKAHNVWAILMPAAQFRSHFVRGMERHPNWPIVFINDRQKLFVDITTTKGRQLLEGIFTGKTIYPNDFTRNLTVAHTMLRLGKDTNAHRNGLNYAIQAFRLQPSQAAMQTIVSASRFGELRKTVYGFCKQYLDDFAKNKNQYAKEDAYLHRLWSALISCQHLERVAKSQGNTELAQSYAAQRELYNSEQHPLLISKRW